MAKWNALLHFVYHKARFVPLFGEIAYFARRINLLPVAEITAVNDSEENEPEGLGPFPSRLPMSQTTPMSVWQAFVNSTLLSYNVDVLASFLLFGCVITSSRTPYGLLTTLLSLFIFLSLFKSNNILLLSRTAISCNHSCLRFRGSAAQYLGDRLRGHHFIMDLAPADAEWNSHMRNRESAFRRPHQSIYISSFLSAIIGQGRCFHTRVDRLRSSSRLAPVGDPRVRRECGLLFPMRSRPVSLARVGRHLHVYSDRLWCGTPSHRHFCTAAIWVLKNFETSE